MFNWLRKLLGPSKQEVDAMKDLLKRYEERLTEQTEQKTALEEQCTVLRTQLDEHTAKRNSTDPWVEIRAADFNELKGIHIELDWNDAFIQHLKDNGIKGRDEETIVQKWLALLYQDLITKLEHVSVDNTDRNVIRDFDIDSM